MKLILSLLAFSVLTLTLSAQQLAFSPSIAKEEVRLSPEHAMGGRVSDWISDLSYFPLAFKNTSDLISDVKDVHQNGKFITVISSKGSSTEKKKYSIHLFTTQGEKIKSINIDDILKSGEVIRSVHNWESDFLITTTSNLIKLSNDGNFTLTDYKSNTEIYTDSLKIENSVWRYRSPRDFQRSKRENALTLNNNAIVNYEDSKMPIVSFDLQSTFSSVYETEGLIYLAFPYHYKVFELNSKEIQKIYDFILPLSYTLDTATYFSITNPQQINKIFAKQPDVTLGFNKIIRYKDYLIIKLAGVNLVRFNWFAYNLKTKELINLKNIIPDVSNDYMPLYGWNGYLSTDGEYLYSTIYPSEIEGAKKKSGIEGHILRAEYSKLLNHKNPILVRFKLN